MSSLLCQDEELTEPVLNFLNPILQALYTKYVSGSPDEKGPGGLSL